MKLVSSRDPADVMSFLSAAAGALARGGGLYVPAARARWPDLPALLALDFHTRSGEILSRWLGDELSRAELENLVRDAFTFPAPLVRVREGVYALELFHGPTLAFKDFGARFLARVLALVRRREGATMRRTVLTATSGDTGAAVAHAFLGLEGFEVAVLYPRGRVSPLQEAQMATLGGNVRCFAVEGSFDDCQALVKACFADASLSHELGLVAANSINIARVLAQALYYFEALARLPPGPAPWIAVPSGNFGNLYAGLLAREAGLPVRGFVVATNANRTVPDFLAGGAYSPRASVATLSNAMDVGAPSNWERIRALYRGDETAMRRDLLAGSVSDEETLAAMRALAAEGTLTDPHAAVAFAVLERHRERSERGIFLATAHPAKFPEVVTEALGQPPELPPSLAALGGRPVLAEPLANDLAALRTRLRASAQSAPVSAPPQTLPAGLK